MNNTELLILLCVILVACIIFTYFGSKFIARQFNMSFIIVFLIGCFLPFIWFPMLIIAVFMRIIDGPRYDERYPEPYYYQHRGPY